MVSNVVVHNDFEVEIIEKLHQFLLPIRKRGKTINNFHLVNDECCILDCNPENSVVVWETIENDSKEFWKLQVCHLISRMNLEVNYYFYKIPRENLVWKKRKNQRVILQGGSEKTLDEVINIRVPPYHIGSPATTL